MTPPPIWPLLGLFFLSGAAALLFQTLWFRLAGLTFGNSVWASSLVLSSFMGGLALGNLAAARYGRRARNPVRLYGWLELLVGVSGFLLVLAFPSLTSLLAPAFRALLDHSWELNSLRLGTAFVLLLVPTTAMGATLPLLVKAISRRTNFGAALGHLYGWNTLGAVCGALAGELGLLPWLGTFR